jgi:hypothetical protein
MYILYIWEFVDSGQSNKLRKIVQIPFYILCNLQFSDMKRNILETIYISFNAYNSISMHPEWHF